LHQSNDLGRTQLQETNTDLRVIVFRETDFIAQRREARCSSASRSYCREELSCI
jgi:hypothetical protein